RARRAGRPPPREPPRPGRRPLLHLTQRSDERPGGAPAAEARDHARRAARRRRRGVAPARVPGREPGSSGRELGEVVDPQALLDRGDLVHHALEAALAEKLVLPPLEPVSEPPVLPLRDQAVQRREE